MDGTKSFKAPKHNGNSNEEVLKAHCFLPSLHLSGSDFVSLRVDSFILVGGERECLLL